MLASGFVGITIKNRITKKYQFFVNFDRFLNYLTINIAFFQKRLTLCVSNFANESSSKDMFYFDLERCLKANNFSKESVTNLLSKTLSKQEALQIAEFLIELSSSPEHKVEELISKEQSIIKSKLQEYSQKQKSVGSLAQKLSLCVGAIICILIY